MLNSLLHSAGDYRAPSMCQAARHWGACDRGGHSDGDHGNDHGVRMSLRMTVRVEPCSKSSQSAAGSTEGTMIAGV